VPRCGLTISDSVWPMSVDLMWPAASWGVSCWCLKSIRVGTSRDNLVHHVDQAQRVGEGDDAQTRGGVAAGRSPRLPSATPLSVIAAAISSVISMARLPSVLSWNVATTS